MSKYHPIGKEISIESMRYMREEEHMTNREIAERLGISAATVYNYLGKMPPELIREIRVRAGSMGGKARWGGVASDQRVPITPPQEEPDAVLLVRDRTIRLTGDAENYVVNCSDKTVIICFEEEGAGPVTIKLDKLPVLIAELSAINRKCGQLNVTPEMW